MYIRFITGGIDADFGFELGVFQAAHRLKEEGRLLGYEKARLTELLEWSDANLREPTKFTTSKPPYYRRQNRAMCWLKNTATEHISQLREIVSILDRHEIHTEMIQTAGPGYVVYEDEFQIVAEPFSDADF